METVLPMLVYLAFWGVALLLVMKRGSESSEAPSRRGRDALIFQFVGLGFLVVGVVLEAVFWGRLDEAAGMGQSAAITYMMVYYVLNFWSIICAMQAGYRGEKKRPALAALWLAVLLVPISLILD